MNLARIERLPDGRFAILTPYDEALVKTIKRVPGMTWTPARKAWVGYSDAIELAAERIHAAKLARVSGWPPASPIRGPLSNIVESMSLRLYQREGVSFLSGAARTGALLADAMGLGKSAETLAAIAQLNAYPALIVCPANVKSSWVNEASRLNLPEPLVLEGRKPLDGKLAPEDGIAIVNYDILPAWQGALSSAKTVAFDEAQMLSNPKSQRSQSAKSITKSAAYRIALSGTPMQNRPAELWNIVDTISPGRFGKFFPFALRFCGAHQVEIKKKDVAEDKEGEQETRKVWDYKGTSHPEELARRLKHFSLRRTKQDVALELPPKTRTLIDVDLPDYSNPDNWWTVDNKNAAQVALALAGTLKTPAAIDLARRALEEPDNRIVVFCYSKAVAAGLLEAFGKAGIAAYRATGDESAERREANAARCKAENAVLVATVDAVGTGVNYLAYANVLIFAELHYVPGRLLQAEDRAHRFGQKQHVLVYYLIAQGTIDEVIRDRLRIKLDSMERVIGASGETLGSDLMGETEEEAIAAIREVARKMQEREAMRLT